MSGTESADLPHGLKLHTHTFDGPGLWGMGLTMLADASLYGSLVFGWLFLWTVAPSWQPPAESPIGTWPLLGVAALLGAGRWSMRGVVKRLRGCRNAGDGQGDGANRSKVEREAPALVGSLWTAAGCGLAAAVGLAALLVLAPLAPTRSAHDAMLAFLLSFLLLHTLLALVLSVLQALRVRRGYVGAAAPYEPVVVGSFWSFTAGAAAVAWLAFALLPLAFNR